MVVGVAPFLVDRTSSQAPCDPFIFLQILKFHICRRVLRSGSGRPGQWLTGKDLFDHRREELQKPVLVIAIKAGLIPGLTEFGADFYVKRTSETRESHPQAVSCGRGPA